MMPVVYILCHQLATKKKKTKISDWTMQIDSGKWSIGKSPPSGLPSLNTILITAKRSESTVGWKDKGGFTNVPQSPYNKQGMLIDLFETFLFCFFAVVVWTVFGGQGTNLAPFDLWTNCACDNCHLLNAVVGAPQNNTAQVAFVVQAVPSKPFFCCWACCTSNLRYVIMSCSSHYATWKQS